MQPGAARESRRPPAFRSRIRDRETFRRGGPFAAPRGGVGSLRPSTSSSSNKSPPVIGAASASRTVTRCPSPSTRPLRSPVSVCASGS